MDDIGHPAAIGGALESIDADAAGPASNGSGLRVRLFEPRDRESTLRLMRQLHTVMPFRNQPFSDEKFDKRLRELLARPNTSVALVAERGTEVVGAAAGHIAPYILSDGPPFCTVEVIVVDFKSPPLRRAKVFLALIAGLKQWAASKGASHTFVHVTTGSNLKATDKLMRASGAEIIGGAYVA
ncbi:GNAT family N-acetyltransferase [Pleomorphomonas koreensis]|uniref:GNAT family N-acetyltransferase n=1 Tax=Pleomorphomonas koreensis TaxID=257440 RepID=UPI00040256F3|nr:GNAT family N-acetyltransferase [Pleomorphomonas koreensis]